MIIFMLCYFSCSVISSTDGDDGRDDVDDDGDGDDDDGDPPCCSMISLRC